MHNKRAFLRRIIIFTLCLVMTLENTGGLVYGADEDVMLGDFTVDVAVSDAGELQAEYDEVELNSSGGLVTTYYPAYEMALFSTDAKTTLKTRISNALDNYEVEVDISDLGLVYGDVEDLQLMRDALSEVISSDYRYFFVSGTFTYWRDGQNNLIQLDLYYKNEFVNEDTTINVSAIETQLAILKERVNHALSFVSDEMSDLEKAVILHDYLVTVCDYDYANYLAGTIPEESYQIWGVLVNNTAVCQGYSEAYSTLLKEAGIDSVIVASDEMNHAWNMVYLDGYWYHVDVTWDDPTWSGYTWFSSVNNDYADIGFVYHKFFLKSDDEFLGLEHSGWTEIVEATNSGAFDTYVFANNSNPMNLMYYNSYWYYVSTRNNPKLYKVKLDGSESSNVSLDGTSYYAGMIGSKIYYAGKEAIYSYDLSTSANEEVVNIGSSYPGYELTEFVTRYDSLKAVLYNSSTGDFKEVDIAVEIPKAPINVTGVTLDKTSLSFTSVGSTQKLTATVAPADADNKSVTWISSDKSVATVDANGVVTSVGNGTATITVTTADGSKTATCTVTVNIPVSVTGVTLDKTSLSFTSLSGTQQLTANVTPSNAANKGVTWTSSDKSVATVDANGKVTPVGNGTAVITVTTADGNKTAKCNVSVSIAATGVVLDKASLIFTDTSSSAQLTATVEPENAVNKNVTWTSSNKAVATVDSNGKVTPVGDGTAVITVTTVDGGYTAQCKVTVGIIVAATGVKLDKSEITLTDMSETAKVTATISPSNASNLNVTWTSSDKSVATVDGTGKITPVGNGITIITVTTEDGSFTASCTVTVEIPEPVTDPLEAFVVRMYTIALERDQVDEAGKASWVGGLKDGTLDGAAVSQGVFMSLEFSAKTETDDEFLNKLYQTFFSREGDESGYNNWMNHLNAGFSRAFVLSHFVNSEEFMNLCAEYNIERGVMLEDGTPVNIGVSKFVTRLYNVVLLRNPDFAGYTDWIKKIATKENDTATVAASFFGSQEYIQKNKSNGDYLTDLYAAFFNRLPDEGGYNEWLAKLNAGTETRESIIKGFTGAQEWLTLLAEFGL